MEENERKRKPVVQKEIRKKKKD